MRPKPILTAVACLAGGFLLGRTRAPETFASPSGQTKISASESSPSASRSHRSAVRAATPAASLAEISGLPATDDRSLVVVPASLLGYGGPPRSLGDDLFSGDGSVEAGLQITETEKIALQDGWRNVRSRIRDLEAIRSTSQELADGSVHIVIPEIAAQLADIGRDFERTAVDHLGPNRAQAFLAIQRVPQLFETKPNEAAFNISVEGTGDGNWRYRTESVSAGGDHQVWGGDSIPLAIRHLTDAAHIPPTLGSGRPGND